MKAVAFILLLATGAFSQQLPLDPVKDFLDGAHIAFTGSAVDNESCLDKDSQIALFEHIVRICGDLSDFASIQKLFLELLLAGDDVKALLKDCDVEVFTESVSENFDRLGSEFILEKLLSNFEEIQTRAQSVLDNFEVLNFQQAGAEFGNLFGLLFEKAPDAILTMEPLEANFFTPIFARASNFTLGMALGFQSKPTPLSSCFNNTQRIKPAYDDAERMAERCLKFNFTACNQVPGMLTIFNAQAQTSYNSCKIVELISVIEALKSPVNFSEMVFKYFSQQVAITSAKNLMNKDFAKNDFYNAGIQFATIFRLLLGFSVS